MNTFDTFDGEFDYLPLTAHIELGAVPTHPTSTDFHLAVSAFEHEQTPASLWRLEAIRWRLANLGKALDLAAIKLVVAGRLYKEVTA